MAKPAANTTAASPPNRSIAIRLNKPRTDTCPLPLGIGMEKCEAVRNANRSSSTIEGPNLESGIRIDEKATAKAPATLTKRMNHLGARYLYIGLGRVAAFSGLVKEATGCRRPRVALCGPITENREKPMK